MAKANRSTLHTVYRHTTVCHAGQQWHDRLSRRTTTTRYSPEA